MSLTKAQRTPLLTVHVIASVGVLGADLSLLALDVSGAGSAAAAQVYPAAHTLAEWLVAPLALLALISGIVLASAGEYGLARYWWTAIKLAITFVLTVLVFVLVVPKLGTAATDATGAAGAVPSSQRRLLEIIPIVAVVLLALNAALAVAKPGWRIGGRGES